MEDTGPRPPSRAGRPTRRTRPPTGISRPRKHPARTRARIADEPVRRLADQNLGGGGRLLEPGRHVDCVAGYERLPLRRVARDDLAAVHSGPDRKLDAIALLELL